MIGQLERCIAAPTATPERIVEVMGAAKSVTTGEPLQLTRELRKRLDDMALLHGGDGKVHIHGRLFAQWLHHAFPTECPFPHVSGSSDPVTPDGWLMEDVSASEEEMRQHVDRAADILTAEGQEIVMPWEEHEELLGAKHVNLKDAATSLAFELSDERKERLKQFRNAMQPYFAAWPKDATASSIRQHGMCSTASSSSGTTGTSRVSSPMETHSMRMGQVSRTKIGCQSTC